MTTTREFETTLAAEGGKVRLYVPFDPNEIWGRKSRHHVSGILGGAAFQGSLGSAGGRFFMPVNKALQASAGAVGGASVRVSIAPADPVVAPIPDDLAAALAAEPGARAFFDGLSAFYRSEWIEWVDGAKREETREDRLTAAVLALAAGRKQR